MVNPAERRAPVEPTVHRHPIPLERIDPDAVKVVRRLTRHNHQAYLVGGCVRDLLLDRRPKDFDVATSARPGEVRSLFRNCRIIGRRFRLAHILFSDRKVIEVATFRRDPEESREVVVDESDLLIRADNVFGDPDEDAVRRDFTINALFYDVDRGEIIDFIGGMTDIERRVVRTIGDPDIRFREDPVRILRAIKFAARLDLGIAPDVLDAIVVNRGELARAARPRLLEEVLRLLRGGAAHRSTWLMWETGALSVVLPELGTFLDDDGPATRAVWAGLQGVDAIHRSGRQLSDAVLFGVLLREPLKEAASDSDDPGAAIDAFLHPLVERLVLPRRLRDRVRQAMLVQRKLHLGPRGRMAALLTRDFSADALDLYEVQGRSEGREADSALEAWRAAQELAGTPDSAPPRSRRRGGRRRRRALVE